MAALRFAIKHIIDDKSDKYAFREDIMKTNPNKKAGKKGQNKRKLDNGTGSTKRSRS